MRALGGTGLAAQGHLAESLIADRTCLRHVEDRARSPCPRLIVFACATARRRLRSNDEGAARRGRRPRPNAGAATVDKLGARAASRGRARGPSAAKGARRAPYRRAGPSRYEISGREGVPGMRNCYMVESSARLVKTEPHCRSAHILLSCDQSHESTLLHHSLLPACYAKSPCYANKTLLRATLWREGINLRWGEGGSAPQLHVPARGSHLAAPRSALSVRFGVMRVETMHCCRVWLLLASFAILPRRITASKPECLKGRRRRQARECITAKDGLRCASVS